MTGEGRAMSGIQTEVLAANVKYSSDFGAKWLLRVSNSGVEQSGCAGCFARWREYS
jgi:hypothetical protein